jgi:sulfatase maturation enzyme AslB (radical SAM superfamily)
MDTLHFILTNECNAYQMPRTANSPGVCKFCYRQTGKIETTPEILKHIFKKISNYKKINEIVITGGEPLVSPYFEQVINNTNALNIYTTLHTNGILLEPELSYLEEKVSCISLPLDGSNSGTQDYYRGKGFFDLTMSNITKTQQKGFDIGINTFVSERNLQDIGYIAKIVSKIEPKYWLLSQYREINLNQRIGCDVYRSNRSKFKQVIMKLSDEYSELKIYSLESEQDIYPERVWVQADGRVYTDLTRNSQNILLGNLLERNLEEFINMIKQLKLKERGALND